MRGECAVRRGHLPAADVSVVLTINKAPLSIQVADTIKLEGDANPQFRFIYSGFVYNETAAALLSLPVATTTASTNSLPGIYTVNVDGASSNNYSISYTSGKLTIYPKDSTLQTINAYNNNSGQVIVKLFSPETDWGRIEIYDQLGRYLGKKDIYVGKGFTTNQFEISNFSSAYYIVSFVGTKRRISKMFSVIK